ncbi:hypothetical protein BAG01nite_11490 [Brevibacillus agri]|uniref:Uncharacterized protein n=1 Tax=Brevibacillus agri TaxID=51101 RepID=A0ABQ0SM97_9BACL|nr:hypothetical protein PMI08_01228 [Brevibacillus sp. CF112]QAV12963.1 hypothetical protein BA6348_09430 [Brevibacillus agri]GED25047.1 hypothetical protein BAG01nite_11490 [Brevibacillus agri]
MIGKHLLIKKRDPVGLAFHVQIRMDKILVQYKGNEGFASGLAQPSFLICLADVFARTALIQTA